jgi:hypothetical protein
LIFISLFTDYQYEVSEFQNIVAFDPKNDYFISKTKYGTSETENYWLYDLATRDEIHIEIQPDDANNVKWLSRDGNRLIAFISDYNIHSHQNYNKLCVLEMDPNQSIKKFAYSRDLEMSISSEKLISEADIVDLENQRIAVQFDNQSFVYSYSDKINEIQTIELEADYKHIFYKTDLPGQTIRFFSYNRKDSTIIINGKKINIFDEIKSSEFSSSGEQVIIKTTNYIRVFDFTTGKIISEYPINNFTAKDNLFNPNYFSVSEDNKYFFLVNPNEKKSIVRFNFPQLLPLETNTTAKNLDTVFANLGTFSYTTIQNAQVKIWNSKNHNLIISHTYKVMDAKNICLDYSSTQAKIAYQMKDSSVIIHNLYDSHGELIIKPKFNTVIGLTFSPDGSNLCIVSSNGLRGSAFIETWDLNTLEKLTSFDTQLSGITKVYPTNSPNHVIIASLELTELSYQPLSIHLWNIKEMKQEASIDAFFEKFIYGDMSDIPDLYRVHAPVFSRRLNHFLTFEADGIHIRNLTQLADETIISFNQEKDFQYNYQSAAGFTFDENYVWCTSINGIISIFDVKQKKLIGSTKLDESYKSCGIKKVIFTKNNEYALLALKKNSESQHNILRYTNDLNEDRNFFFKYLLEAEISDIFYINNEENFISYSADFLNFYSVSESDKCLVTKYIYDDNYINIVHEGYYFLYNHNNSTELFNQLYFVNDKLETYTFEQFDLKYNRPDIVLERLGNSDSALIQAYHQAYLKRLKKMNFTEEMLEDDFHIPKISIENFEMMPTITASKEIELNLNIEDTKYPLDRINVWVNDVAVFGSNGISLRTLNTHKLNRAITIPLAKGKNEIQISVLNQAGAESYKKSFEVESTSGKSKPDLFLVSVGVSEYKDSRFNLTYASKDAMDIVKSFEQNKYYGKVQTMLLKDQEVILENLDQLRSFLNLADINDQVIIFIAGHGVLDANFNYYFASHDIDFQNPSGRGIPYEMIEALLDGIKPLKKLLLMDTCHSGEIDKDEIQISDNKSGSENDITFRNVGAGVENKENQLGLQNTSELMKSLFTDLRKGTGATVISSAGGVEFAMESSTWQNGLFTYCLIDGLTNKKADLNNDLQITVSEIQKFVQNEVNRLSKGRQNPTSRIENNELDYRIW